MQLTLDRGTDRLAVTVHPATAPDGPFYVVVPAMGVPARYYGPLVDALLATGAGAAIADLRGTGDSTPAPSRRAKYGYADLVDDLGAVLAATSAYRQGRSTILFGHSLGGHLSVLHAGRAASEKPDGIVLVASGLP
jgi:predicted alpha/beta hydrolase